MKDRQTQYALVKRLIEVGHITVFRELFDILRPTPTAKALGINYSRFKKRIELVEEWAFKDAYALAKLIGVDDRVILDLIHNQHMQPPKKRKK